MHLVFLKKKQNNFKIFGPKGRKNKIAKNVKNAIISRDFWDDFWRAKRAEKNCPVSKNLKKNTGRGLLGDAEDARGGGQACPWQGQRKARGGGGIHLLPS